MPDSIGSSQESLNERSKTSIEEDHADDSSIDECHLMDRVVKRVELVYTEFPPAADSRYTKLILTSDDHIPYLHSCLKIAEEMFEPERLRHRVSKIDMERISSEDIARKLLFDERVFLSKKSYIWMRDLLTAKCKLNPKDVPHFFRSALTQARKQCKRLYLFFL
jgi:hypothetical protein